MSSEVLLLDNTITQVAFTDYHGRSVTLYFKVNYDTCMFSFAYKQPKLRDVHLPGGIQILYGYTYKQQLDVCLIS